MYKMKTQLQVGERAEQAVLAWLIEQGYSAYRTDRQSDEIGADIVVSGNDRERAFSIDVKSDTLAHYTGNFFVEIMSSVENGSLSWLYKVGGKFIFFCIPQTGSVYIVKKSQLRKAIFSKWKLLPWRPVQNEGYTTMGIPVPIREIEQIATKKVSLPKWE